MSQKVQNCSVLLENIVQDKMENSKKRGGKSSRQSTPVPVEVVVVPDNVDNESTSSKASETSQPNNAKISNGRGKSKKDKAGSKKSATNGVSDVALNTNGTSHANGTSGEAHPEVIEEEALVPEQDNDELFPELIYDETSDNECNFDSSSPDFNSAGRSMTRRSQAKIIPTPETPQLLNSKPDTLVETSSSPVVEQELSDRPPSSNTPQPDTPQREKVLKMKEMYSLTPTNGTPASDKVIKDADTGAGDDSTKNGSNNAAEVSHSKIDTNFSKSRIKVSPYRRSTRISDQFSTMANYSGNNSTQDTDLVGDISSSSRDRSPVVEGSEDSTMEEGQSGSERSVSESFRSIKGRKSYRPLREYSLKNLLVQRHKAAKAEAEKNDETISSVNATIGSEIPTMLSEPSPKWTPVGHVVGRKRKQSPERDSIISVGVESPVSVALEPEKDTSLERPSKRQRLLGYVSTPLRNLRDKMSSSTPLLGRYTMTRKETVTISGTEEIPGTSQSNAPMIAEPVPEHKWCLIM